MTLKGRTAKAKTSRSVKEFKVDVEVGPKVDVEVGPAARTQNDCFDPVTDKIEPRERLSPDSFSECVDDGSLLNKFSMMWELRERFPLHFFVFKLPATYRTRPTSSKSFSE